MQNQGALLAGLPSFSTTFLEEHTMANIARVVALSAAKQTRLVDELGALRVQMAALEDAYNQKISVFKDFGDGEYVGKAYKVVVNTAVRSSLDTKVVKGFLTPAEIAQATVNKAVTTALVKAR